MARRGRPRHPDILTPREWEVLALLREGLTNEQIAERLGVTYHAARFHVGEILSKLQVATREQAAAWQPPPERRADVWTRALEGAVALAAAALIGALAVLAFGVFKSSGGDAGVATGRPAGSPAASPILTVPANIGPSVRLMQVVDNSGKALTSDAFWSYGFVSIPGTPISFSPYVLNITPPGVLPTNITGMYFLDQTNGWLVVDGPPRKCLACSEPPIVYRTADGGASWAKSPVLPDPDGDHLVDIGDPAYITFADDQHGWVLVRTLTAKDPTGGALYRTTDGGATWELIAFRPGDPIVFFNENDGWSAGVAGLWQTHDGGKTWTAGGLVFHGPVGTSWEFGLPSMVAGAIVVPVLSHYASPSSPDEESVSLQLLWSGDNGTNWESVPNNGTLTPEQHPGTAMVTQVLPDGSAVGMSWSDGYTEAYDSSSGKWSAFQPSGLIGRVLDIDFVDKDNGWALVELASTCLGPGPLPIGQVNPCESKHIEWTNDGGRTWNPLLISGASPSPTLTP